MNNKTKTVLSALFTVALTACGGGGDSETGSPTFTSGNNGSSAGTTVAMSAPTATVSKSQAE